MKKQYLGDVRDLFKYDLIQHILKEISSLRKFAFIPMLTENEGSESGDGNKRDFARAKKKKKPGTGNGDLMRVLEKYKEIGENKRDFTEIEKYFKSKDIKMLLYKEKGREYFEHSPTDDYFKNIPKSLLHKSLLFVDPDIGLQIEKSTKKHVLCREVNYLYSHMDEDSILMIYQHFPRARNKYPEYSPEGRSNKLEKETGNLPIYISDNEIMFFLLTRSDKLRGKLERTIKSYQRDYPKLKIRGVVN